MDQNKSGKSQAVAEQSSLSLYLRELRGLALLSSEEEQACARQAAEGDAKARQRLVQANLRFVVRVAKRYRYRGLPLEDLINEGNIGLIQAAERFDPGRGVHFVSYAVWWIRQAILRAIQENGRPIRLPKGPAGALARIGELQDEGMMQSGSEPPLGEIAASLGVEEGELVTLMQAGQRTLSLDSPVGDASNPDTFGAFLEDRSIPGPEAVLVGASLHQELDSLLAGLSDREACILQDRFGLAGRKRISLLEASRKHGLSRERVRQIEKRALRKIRACEGVGQLKVYAN